MKFHAKTIRQQILYPFLVILITLPIAIIIFFNIGITFIMQHSAKNELESTMTTMESLLNSDRAAASEEVADMAKELSAGLTAARLAGNTRFYIFYNQEIKYPLDLEGDKTADYFRQKAAEEGIETDSEIHSCRVDGSQCFYKSLTLEHYDEYTDLSILFVTDFGEYTGWVVSLNLVLLLVLVLTVSVSVILVLRIADSISRPIIDACTYAAQIGNGDFITVPIVESNAEIKQFCTSLNAMSTRLKAYDETQKQFLQNASHELRTPLMSIQGYAEGIEGDVFSDPKEAAGVIRKESLRLNKLVTELLTLSRIENNTYVHQLQSCPVSELILDYIQRVQGLLLKSSLEVKTNFSTHASSDIDEGLFSQTVINIISNAARYAKTTIMIDTFQEKLGEKEWIVVEIADDGDGIGEEELPHLFERFYKGRKGNFGLGLAISKSAMESMGGNLTAFNRNGAVFRLELPVSEKEE